MVTNFAKYALDNGGSINPLLVPSNLTNGTGLCNPSILSHNGKLLVNIRHVSYDFYHSEYLQKFPSWHGFLIYLHPEDDITLRTDNYLGELNDKLEVVNVRKIEMTLDVAPKWTFIGLEDARLIYWDNKLYVCGVRRDTNPQGHGRMELSKLKVTKTSVKEVSRVRIEPPDPKSVLEKNWMPVIDQPYTFVKWSNPTEVVKVYENELRAETISLKDSKVEFTRDLRGGSQLIPFDGDKYIAVIHEVELWHHEETYKDAQYYHRFIIYDKDFQVIAASTDFKFMDTRVEFSCGMALHKGDYYITYGFQDNAAYVLKLSPEALKNFVYNVK